MGASQQVRAEDARTAQGPEAEIFDVLIVGAGISGIGSAWYLQRECSDKTFALLECKESFGGTWHTHRYPGVRSDSDLYTFGYSFKPWVEEPIATAERINAYLKAVLEENDLARHIRYRHRVLEASWSDEEALWTLDVRHEDSGKMQRFKARFLWMCQGYYRHERAIPRGGKAWRTSRAVSCIPRPGPTTSTAPTSRWRSSARARRRRPLLPALAGDGRTRSP